MTSATGPGERVLLAGPQSVGGRRQYTLRSLPVWSEEDCQVSHPAVSSHQLHCSASDEPTDALHARQSVKDYTVHQHPITPKNAQCAVYVTKVLYRKYNRPKLQIRRWYEQDDHADVSAVSPCWQRKPNVRTNLFGRRHNKLWLATSITWRVGLCAGMAILATRPDP